MIKKLHDRRRELNLNPSPCYFWKALTLAYRNLLKLFGSWSYWKLLYLHYSVARFKQLRNGLWLSGFIITYNIINLWSSLSINTTSLTKNIFGTQMLVFNFCQVRQCKKCFLHFFARLCEYFDVIARDHQKDGNKSNLLVWQKVNEAKMFKHRWAIGADEGHIKVF